MNLKPTYEGLKGKLGDVVNVVKYHLKPTYEGLKVREYGKIRPDAKNLKPTYEGLKDSPLIGCPATYQI